MKRSVATTTFLACLLLSSLYGHTYASAEAESGVAKETNDHPLEPMAETVVLIQSLTSDPGKINAGTGFMIRHNQRWYFVTAKHVVTGDLSETSILGNRKDGVVARFPVSEIEKGLPGSAWFGHPTADIAIHPFAPNVVRGFTGKLIYGETLYEGKAHLLDQLVAIGFQYTVGANLTGEQLSPIAKETKLVSWPVESTGALEKSSNVYLLIDPPLYPGFSGAPIYSFDATPGSSPFRKRYITLVGVYVGTTPRIGEPERELFLGRVVPAKILIDLLNSDAVKDYEKNSAPIEEAGKADAP